MKNVFFIAAILLCVNVIVAQEDRFKFGVHFGAELVLNGETSNGYTNTRDNFGRPHLGLAFNIAFTEKMGLQPEINYQNRYVAFSSADSDTSETGVSYEHLNIPIMFEYKFIPGLSVQAGPRTSINVAVSDPDTNTFTSFINGTGVELGFLAGVQYITPFDLFTNIRVGKALTNEGVTDTNTKYTTVRFALGYFF